MKMASTEEGMHVGVVGVVRKLGKGLWAAACGAALLVAALGLLPLMAGLLCDLVLAPFRWHTCYIARSAWHWGPFQYNVFDGATSASTLSRAPRM